MAAAPEKPLWDLSSPDMPPADENGVDLEQIEHHLSLTPAQRLEQLQAFADFIFTIWKSRGIDWLDIEKSSNI